MSVPTNEVRNNLERNPGLGDPTALGYRPVTYGQPTESACMCKLRMNWIKWAEKSSICIACGVSWEGEPRGSRSEVRPRASWCSKDTGGVEHLDFSAQDLARCICT